jgi:peptidoglycan/xylan/chitin deacetylase (PgdA/CDA1 family)
MEPTLLTWNPVEGVSTYQLLVYDRTDARTVFAETVNGTAHEVPIPDECSNHDLVMRTRPLLGEDWSDWTEFQPLPREFVLGERRDAVRPIGADDNPGLLLVFTIDTECSVLRQPNPDPDRVVDELIFGEFGNGGPPGGIALQMDLLEHFGFRGCFFVDVLMEYEHGQRALERTIEAIVERGHEVELHIHPEHLEWSADPDATSVAAELRGGGMQPEGVFRHVLELSVDLFERRVGRPPIAYRAGAYRISDAHFPVLEEFGIWIDSSVQPYFNSRVADWMRTRTQPFRVGGVLEIPPTFVLLNDRPDAWETRALAPSFGLGDPVSTLSPSPNAPPIVTTLVSHSFQLLRCRESRERDAIGAFEARLRSGLPADTANRMLRTPLNATRTFGEEVDEGLVAHVATILRRIADRPDARCVTYGEVAGMIDRHWPVERFPPVDSIALLNRPQGIASATGTRVFSQGLLLHLAARQAPSSRPNERADSDQVCELECDGVVELRDRLDSAIAELEPAQPLHLRFRTLGIASPGRRGVLPPLAELLFPATTLRALAEEVGAEAGHGVPWDAPTFSAWIERCGFEILSERRVPRGPEEMEALDRFDEKLSCLDPLELRTEALEIELRRARPAQLDPPLDGRQLIALRNGVSAATTEMPAEVAPGSLPVVAAELNESMHPGQELRLRVPDDPQPASRTTLLLALMRAGLEVLDHNDSTYRVMRPVDLPDIRRFAGLD